MEHSSYAGMSRLQTLIIDETWDRAEVGLEHAVSGEFYWLHSQIVFYSGDEMAQFVSLGPCQKSDPERVSAYLREAGFRYASRRINREWEYRVFKG